MQFYFDIAYDRPNGQYIGVAHHEEEREFPSDGGAHTYFLSLLDRFSVRETYYLCRWGEGSKKAAHEAAILEEPGGV
jgi:hypothetical protein